MSILCIEHTFKYLKIVNKMKVIKYISVYFLFINLSIYCQVIDTIIDLNNHSYRDKKIEIGLEFFHDIDTIYVYFDYGKGQKKSFDNNVERIPEFYKNSLVYSFSKDSTNYINLVYRQYKDFDDFALKKETDIKKIKKEFLKIHSNSILTPKLIFNQDFESLFFMLDNKKVYIIDKKEIKCGKLALREISMVTSPYNYKM